MKLVQEISFKFIVGHHSFDKVAFIGQILDILYFWQRSCLPTDEWHAGDLDLIILSILLLNSEIYNPLVISSRLPPPQAWYFKRNSNIFWFSINFIYSCSVNTTPNILSLSHDAIDMDPSPILMKLSIRFPQWTLFSFFSFKAFINHTISKLVRVTPIETCPGLQTPIGWECTFLTTGIRDVFITSLPLNDFCHVFRSIRILSCKK